MEEVSTESTADWGGKSTHRNDSTTKNISAEVFGRLNVHYIIYLIKIKI